jgi:hypothetical protein
LNKNSKSTNTRNNKSKDIKTKQKKNNNKKKDQIKSLTIQELNSLPYQKAIELDNRSYCRYYSSLILKKHLLIFSFIPIKDYNIKSLKVSLFIIIFSLYFTINAFFFNDNSMHRIYMDNGEYNPVYQIPIIIYSSLISLIIQQTLKTLALSENRLLELKHEPSYNKSVELSKMIQRYLKIKFIIYFIFGFCLMFFFWYFISCFCAVYSNTKTILIKDTFLSFGISMFYPFIIYLFPGMFRMWALKSKEKDKKCIYSFSIILSMI